MMTVENCLHIIKQRALLIDDDIQRTCRIVKCYVFLVYFCSLRRFIFKSRKMSDTTVDLGFLDECEPWLLVNKFFPSKVGGLPAWLNLETIPSIDKLKCKECNQILMFLCQVRPHNSLILFFHSLNNNIGLKILLFRFMRL